MNGPGAGEMNGGAREKLFWGRIANSLIFLWAKFPRLFFYINYFFFFVFVDFDFREDEGAFREDEEEEDLLEDFTFEVFDREGVFDFMEFLLGDDPLYDPIDLMIFSDVLLSFDK